MTVTDPVDRAQVPHVAAEGTMLLQMLAFQRDTLRWKCSGLSAAHLAQTHEPSSLSLLALLKHVALVEAYWMTITLAGGDPAPQWLLEQDMDADDWTLVVGAEETPEVLHARLDEAQQLTEALVGQSSDLDVLARDTVEGELCSLRWILLHLVQEYARHNGHADLLREAIDGSVGI